MKNNFINLIYVKMKKWFLIKSLFVFALLIIGSCNKNKSLQIVSKSVSNYEIVYVGNVTKICINLPNY